MRNEVEIFDISYDGAGVGKLDGKIAFVPKTLPGELVDVHIEKENSKFCVARLENIKRPSELRQKAFCPYFDICGGCDFQHCSYDKELELKNQIVSSELKKAGWMGNIEFFQSDKRFFYRNKIKVEVFENKLGYFKKGTNEFFEIKNCPIAKKEINDALVQVQKFLNKNHMNALKNVYIKQIEKKISICFLFGKNTKIEAKNLKNIEILSDFLTFFAFGDVLESNSTKVVQAFGNEKLTRKVFDKDIEIDVSAFNQINDFIADKLYEYVCAAVKGKNVLNAYSGQGLLSALISKASKFVVGIEYQKCAHDSAQNLKNLLGIKNLKNVCGKVEDKLSGILKNKNFDVIVLDPARAGCQKSVLDSIKCEKISEIVYISCNFSSLVRDLRILSSNYLIKNIKVFDMFPCTANVETVAILERV